MVMHYYFIQSKTGCNSNIFFIHPKCITFSFLNARTMESIKPIKHHLKAVKSQPSTQKEQII